jgi:DNA-binding NtrC family response regulator
VRELRNAVKRAVLMSIGTTITAEDLSLREPPSFGPTRSPMPVPARRSPTSSAR